MKWIPAGVSIGGAHESGFLLIILGSTSGSPFCGNPIRTYLEIVTLRQDFPPKSSYAKALA